ncbi:MAG TPA: hypothetical protein PKD55_15315 [Bellilinea sp.]|nr:hypothetical protein [Bellilinea sp.]
MRKLSPANLRKRCIDLAGEDSLVFADGYDAALIGVGCHDGVSIAVYDQKGVIDILRQRDGMTLEDAVEFFEYNIQGARFGDNMPIFVGRA